MTQELGSAATPPYPHLLSPLVVRNLHLRNRMVMGAMHTRLESMDQPMARIKAFYRARAEGEIALIITGGISPNLAGRMEDDAPAMTADADLDWHRAIVDAVRGTDTQVCMQLLHAGRYAKFDGCVGPSSQRARINKFAPHVLTTQEVYETIADYASAAKAAIDIGYHAVEIMGSEGYLINEFTAPCTNDRSDEFGGDFEGRIRFPLDIIKAVRQAVGPDFAIIYRISALDLVEGGMTGDETLELARRAEAAGADILNTGIGWHESDVPTVSHNVPRAGWAYAVQRIKEVVTIPVMASNRINAPGVAEDILASSQADLVSMARPLLADPDFARKARLGQANRINTCIACNQACLDNIFKHKTATCLVNPRAGRELDWLTQPTPHPKRIAVVGAGAAGMNFAFSAAERGHHVTLFEAAAETGGQLCLARNVPGKTEFDEMLRYFRGRLAEEQVELKLNCAVTAEQLARGGFDEVVLASGVRPRLPEFLGSHRPDVLRYDQVLSGAATVGERVLILGAGAIAYDMVEFLLGDAPHSPPALDNFAAEYGLDLSAQSAGGRSPRPAQMPARRQVTMLQRSDKRPGASLAMTTGWIRRDKVQRFGVPILTGANIQHIDDVGLHYTAADGSVTTLPFDTVIICAGQEPVRELEAQLKTIAPNLPVHVVGGADKAAELDARRAIEQASRLALEI
ncbi:MAG: NADPH-dependent 2,4-dienoyl-CoA reductase [Rhodoferax sp.]|uniref:oxidoreductase n=1 Tax=Rhodoferax sp. TaxID=50421 RepID=UPI002602F752|nr:NADPH-dependent 2,4-dienoyl-CoA reductase [Rhodoferax sp.]MDD2879826.1 NADPH-dependent 2,4-dienoyl-CoA reductase [Rhodoferax sp.]